MQNYLADNHTDIKKKAILVGLRALPTIDPIWGGVPPPINQNAFMGVEASLLRA